MLKDIDYPDGLTYKTSKDYNPEVFFISHFRESNLVKMHLGFYSSSAFRTISSGFKTFIKNEGKVQLIINHFLNDNDKEILSGKYNDEDLESSDFLLNYLTEKGEYFFKCISYLISKKRIEIKIVKPKNKSGIEHDKSGLFFDGKDKVFYNGSSNWSHTALKENSESLSYLSSWSTDSKVDFTIKEFEEDFDNIFNEKDKTKEYLDPSETKKLTDSIKEKFNIKDESELEIDYDTNNEILKKEIKISERKEYEIDSKPKFYHSYPFKYQEEAYNSWLKNNKNGLFAMATGTGKTITSLLCLLREYEETGYYKCIILVPTVALMEQWIDEVKKFNFGEIYTSKQKEIRDFRRVLNRGKDAIYICTYASFILKKTQGILNDFSEEISNYLLIADEAHNLGSKGQLKKLNPHFKKKIGLSATPDRKYDEEGSKKLYDYFDTDEPCFTYNYSMGKAIENENLSEFEYYPYFTQLQPQELEEYKKLTKELFKCFDKDGNQTEAYNMKLIQRKRIVNSAQNKKKVFRDILNDCQNKWGNNFKHIFVFSPEGYEPNYDKDEDTIIEKEEIKEISNYVRIIGEEFNFKASSYTGEKSIKDRKRILNNFREGKFDALVSMKCLDEGVDVPKTEYAIFLSSTGNPRQFIQRRGRVLRKYPNKIAKIFDIIVSPDISSGLNVNEQKEEKKILENELVRLFDFIALSKNCSDTINNYNLKKLCKKFNIDEYALIKNVRQKNNSCK